MWSVESHGRYQPTVNDDTRIDGGIPQTYNSTKDVLVSFGLSLNCIGSCLKSLKENYHNQTTMDC